jgi:uncharacterized repeat protein (TIGR01451 family)
MLQLRRFTLVHLASRLPVPVSATARAAALSFTITILGTLAAPAPVAAQPLPNLVVQATSGPLAAQPGQRVAYVTTVRNDGPGVATHVSLTFPLATALVFVSNSGDCVTASPCALGTIAPGERRVVTSTYDIPAGFPATPRLLELDAIASGDETEPVDVQWNNYVTASTMLTTYERFFAEGANNTFFETLFHTFNPNPQEVTILYRALRPDGTVFSVVPLTLAPMQRMNLSFTEVAPGEFSMQAASSLPVAIERVMKWDQTGYGTSADSGVAAPALVWHFAEGATGPFQLFYLLANPSPTDSDVRVTFLTSAGAPVVKDYTVGANSRLTIGVNAVPGLSSAEVSGTIEVTSGPPIIADRAMYRGVPGQVFGAGHASSGASALSTTWYFGEGATGAFFDTYLLLANPSASPAEATVTYLLPDGQSLSKNHPVPAQRRVSIGVSGEDARLAATSVGMSIASTLPIMAERAMWWPGAEANHACYEAHAVLGSTLTAPRWAVASARFGGADKHATYVLVSNTGDADGELKLTFVREGQAAVQKTVPIQAHARKTLDMQAEFGQLIGLGANAALGSLLIESVGAPLPLVVERSHYASPGGVFWAAGDATLATPVP